jgi:alkaline phosphatase
MFSALAVCARAETTLRVIPPQGATFAPGQHFDVRIEADDLRGQPRQFTVEVNGHDSKRELFGVEEFNIFRAPVTGRGATTSTIMNGGVIRRDWSLDKAGKYEIKATLTDADGKKYTASSMIVVGDSAPRSRSCEERHSVYWRWYGTFRSNGRADYEQRHRRRKSEGPPGNGSNGNGWLVMTSSLDALVTDSSPGASAWATGNKSLNNWHGVFPDNTGPVTGGGGLDRNTESIRPYLDNPRVENLAEFLQRTRHMSTGVVSTVAVTDSTPGAFSSHSIRYAQNAIAEQMLSSGHSVILGGGARYFLPQDSPLLGNITSARTDGRNLVEEFKKSGFTFVSNATELERAGRVDKLLGLFHGAEMASRYDRNRAKAGINTAKEALGRFQDQPTLELMTQQALNVLGKNPNGFFVMIEAGSIDRELHRLDPNRAVDEVIELDKAIGIARAWSSERGHEETLILVTADHDTAGLVLTGVNENGRPSSRAFPNYEDKNFDGFPDDFQPEFGLTFDFPSSFNPPKDHKANDLPRNIRELNPTVSLPPPAPGGPALAGHSAVDVPISARGPGAILFTGVQDNTEIFFKILRALGEK